MKWKHLYNKLGLSSQITSASYSLKMAYKKHLFPFEEQQRTNGNDKDDEGALENEMSPPAVKTHDQQSADEECGSVSSSKSSNIDQDPDQNGPPPNHNDDDDDDDDDDNTTTDVTTDNVMDTTDNNSNR